MRLRVLLLIPICSWLCGLNWCLKNYGSLPFRNGQGVVAFVSGHALAQVTGNQPHLYGRAFDVRGLTRQKERVDSVRHRSGNRFVEAG